MANTLIRILKSEVGDQIRNYILNMIPEKVRKIVGWILIIFGVVTMLGSWYAGIVFGFPEMGAIIFIFGICSVASGIIFLRGRVNTLL